jgi:two-component system sensor histidine kinase CpxA
MRSLFFKVFIIFWIAQSLIFVISTALILKRQLPDPELLLAPLSDSLAKDSAQVVAAFEARGCGALRDYAEPPRGDVALLDERGMDLCASVRTTAIPANLRLGTESFINGSSHTR